MDNQQTSTNRDELAAYLDMVARGDNYRVIEGLGGSAGGADALRSGTVTELVQFEGANGTALGPFVRKRIDLALGIGGAYEQLFAVQRAGARFVHLARVIECYKTGQELVVVSEYVPGETLDARLAHVGAGEQAARCLIPALCDAVAELHAAVDPPIVHRDLKPSNIIVSGDAEHPVVTLIDFGIARQYRDGATTDTMHFGTRAYAPPEQFGFGQTSVRSDVYALGMLALYCLTGEEPHGQPTGETLAAGGVAPGYAEVILRATAFDPAQRFASATELSSAFAAVCANAHAGVEVQATTSETATDHLSARVPSAPAVSREVAADAPAGEPLAKTVPAAPAAVDAPASAPTASASTRRALFRGHARNVLIACIAMLFVVVSVRSIGDPINGVVQPLWYSLYISYAFTLPLILGVLYLLLDRRSLARVLPRIAARSRRRDAKRLVIYLLIALGVGVVFNLLLL